MSWFNKKSQHSIYQKGDRVKIINVSSPNHGKEGVIITTSPTGEMVLLDTGEQVFVSAMEKLVKLPPKQSSPV